MTVYGPKGESDIARYTGFTMSSDFKKYGAIADGEYTVNYLVPGKSAPLPSNYAVNGGNPVDCLNGINPSPISPYSATQKKWDLYSCNQYQWESRWQYSCIYGMFIDPRWGTME